MIELFAAILVATGVGILLSRWTNSLEKSNPLGHVPPRPLPRRKEIGE